MGDLSAECGKDKWGLNNESSFCESLLDEMTNALWKHGLPPFLYEDAEALAVLKGFWMPFEQRT